MGERRFYTAHEAIGGQVAIDGDEFHHIVHVMRYRHGDELEIVNGRGGLFTGCIAAVGSRSLRVDIRRSEHFPPPPPRVIIASSLTKGHAMNWMVEKLSEMGVDEIRLLSCERTDVACSGAQLQRWQKITAQALKVNRRYWQTRILSPVTPGELVAGTASLPGKILLDVASSGKLDRPVAWPVLAAIGPPGDFTTAEKELFQANGFVPCRVNEAILKTETAALSVAALLKND